MPLPFSSVVYPNIYVHVLNAISHFRRNVSFLKGGQCANYAQTSLQSVFVFKSLVHLR